MARTTKTKVKLVKTFEDTPRFAPSDNYRNTGYAVQKLDGTVIGFVAGDWGEGLGLGMYVQRSRWQRTWEAQDTEGETIGKNVYRGFFDARDDAVDAVIRNAGLEP